MTGKGKKRSASALKAASTSAEHENVALRVHCDALVEEHEELLAERVVDAAQMTGDATRLELCVALSRSCDDLEHLLAKTTPAATASRARVFFSLSLVGLSLFLVPLLSLSLSVIFSARPSLPPPPAALSAPDRVRF